MKNYLLRLDGLYAYLPHCLLDGPQDQCLAAVFIACLLAVCPFEAKVWGKRLPLTVLCAAVIVAAANMAASDINVLASSLSRVPLLDVDKDDNGDDDDNVERRTAWPNSRRAH